MGKTFYVEMVKCLELYYKFQVKVRIMNFKKQPWQDFIPVNLEATGSIHVDLGAGTRPRNPFKCDKIIATDFHKIEGGKTEIEFVVADLTKSLPFEENSINSFSAYDVIEHIPRWERRSDGEITFPFISLMSEIYRCLKPGGIFLAFTPAYPSGAAFQDPTHINFITRETIVYFSGDNPWASGLGYGFKGSFEVIQNDWVLGAGPLSEATSDSGLSVPQSIKQGFRNWARSNPKKLKFSRKIRGLHHDDPTHLLWVLRKPIK